MQALMIHGDVVGSANIVYDFGLGCSLYQGPALSCQCRRTLLCHQDAIGQPLACHCEKAASLTLLALTCQPLAASA